MKRLFKRVKITVCFASFMFLFNSTPTVLAEALSNTDQVNLVEYVYDENNRLIEVKRSGKTIALFNYDKNGNLLNIQPVK